MVVLGKPDEGPYESAASWPRETVDSPSLRAAADAAVSCRQFVVREQERIGDETGQPHDVVAFPLFIAGQLLGVAVVEMVSRPKVQQKATVQLLRWGATWLEAMIQQQSLDATDRLVTLVELVATGLEHANFRAAATDVATELATRFVCDRVSIGFLRGREVRVDAISHSARFNQRTNLVRDLQDAMHESLDQGETIVYPPDARQDILITQAHEALVRKHGAGIVCTLPLVGNGRMLGALMLERPPDRPFDAETVEQCEQVGALVGPVLEMRRREDRWLIQKAWGSFKEVLGKLFGPRYLGWKVAAVLLISLAVFLSVAMGEYRIATRASLEPRVQRAVVAPQDGFIGSARVRAGDIVKGGDTLGELDDKDLLLQQQKWSSQREQLRKEYRRAFAMHDRAQVSILNARIAQAEAQLALIDEEVSRTRLVAPFAGIVVSGDLSQSLGSPVERGQVLFEVAPLDAYRIVLEVDERDVADVVVGQNGHLALSGLPERPLAFVVRKITPVSSTREGRNFFRVEARPELESEVLRPGMEGVGKIEIGRRKLFWIWTHHLVDWLRLWVWSWRP